MRIQITKLLLLTVLILSSDSIQSQNLKTELISTENEKNASESKVFLILDITVNDSIMYEQYRVNVEPMIKKYGGKYLVRSGGILFDNNTKSKVIPIEGN